ncbi:unnamed protein product [Dimorphilus gyrociliatus]|uniref:Katanin p60 ATPase-containing subunit A-like 2 n=1 Tax=Dimorphilus gyrociliatus TaxID=2664684 RepID=A0A7I8VYR0_9ANNE|nr:unnamed protein product [Dimorphilus gyrociliatus]
MAEALSYQSLRSANQAREADEHRTETRKRNLLILVLHYLSEEGYLEAATSLSKETNLDMNKFEVCDNVDLETVLMEYESFHYIKFSKYPKITKKLDGELAKRISKTIANNSNRAKRTANTTPQLPKIPPGTNVNRPRSSSKQKAVNHSEEIRNGLVVQATGQAVHTNSETQQKRVGQIIDMRAMLNEATRLNVEEGSSDKLLKPLGGYTGYSTEWRDLAQVISRDIYLQCPNVRWNDIIGLDSAKSLVKEAVVYPIRYPQLFTGILSPWKGLLLYGPPGTGKTLLAKAVATECKTTFFNISASTIVSKWRGDSEKLVRVLFEMARYHAPSTIFLDELEALMGQRGGGSEHEGSRRMKTELLVQMDGLSKSDDLVFLLAASNLPWELDHAMLRRLEKRILVGLPTLAARQSMFEHYLPHQVTTSPNGLALRADLDYSELASATDGYSGSDIQLVCKEAAMRPVRKIFDALETHSEGQELHFKLDVITTNDVQVALSRTKPSARQLANKYEAWQKEYESA